MPLTPVIRVCPQGGSGWHCPGWGPAQGAGQALAVSPSPDPRHGTAWQWLSASTVAEPCQDSALETAG